MIDKAKALVYSCSVDGTVIVWDVPSLKVKKQFHLSCDRLQSIRVYNDAFMVWKDDHHVWIKQILYR